MIKNIYDKNNKYYEHEYYCDYCFKEIGLGEILRNEEAIKRNMFDLCYKCFKYYEIKKGENND